MTTYSADLDGPRVLVADNDAMIRSVLRALLGKIGQVVSQAANSEDALDLAGRAAFSLVILDLDMPTQGGLHVCAELRRQRAYEAVPIVILTGLADAETRARSQAAGATLFLTKPFNPAELMRVIAPHLRMADPDRPRLAEIIAADRGLRLHDAGIARSHA